MSYMADSLAQVTTKRWQGKEASHGSDSFIRDCPGHRLSQVAPFTNHIAGQLSLIYSNPPYAMRTEWQPMQREEVRAQRFNDFRARRMYSPAIDLAIGPFATHRPYVEEYDRMAAGSAKMLKRMLQCFKENIRQFYSEYPAPTLNQLCTLNPNSRCFMAIEIERGNTSIKYLMGSMFHASALGRIGIVVAWDQRRLRDLMWGREYFLELKSHDKNSFNTTNLMMLSRDQLTSVLEQTVRKNSPVENEPFRLS